MVNGGASYVWQQQVIAASLVAAAHTQPGVSVIVLVSSHVASQACLKHAPWLQPCIMAIHTTGSMRMCALMLGDSSVPATSSTAPAWVAHDL
jgi:hypothetical protein